jgi:hypothetical protein
MSFINGALGLGNAIVSGSIVEPASGTNYARMPVYLNVTATGITNMTPVQFGPVSGTWGSITSFQIFDNSGLPTWVGYLQPTLTPLNAQYLYFPPGQIVLTASGTSNLYSLDFSNPANSQYL